MKSIIPILNKIREEIRISRLMKRPEDREQLRPGMLCAACYPGTYRTRDGRSYYQFLYTERDGCFEVEIISQPSYNGRDEYFQTTWRNVTKVGTICVATMEEDTPVTLKEAQDVSIKWAERTNMYIRTGRTIDEQINQLN